MSLTKRRSLPARFLRWIYKGMTPIPSLMQLAIVELLATACLGAGVMARLVDHYGLSGHPPQASLTWGLLGWLAVGAWFMWLTLRHIWKPGVQNVQWSPVRRLGPIDIVLPNDPAGARYQFLGSHPAYVLMDLLAGVIPAFMTCLTWGDVPRLNPTMHVYHWWLIVWAFVPAARLFCWLVLRRGPEMVAAMTPKMTPSERRRFQWQTFWHGPLVFWIIALAVLIPGSVIAWRETRKMEDTIPLLNTAMLREIQAAPAGHNDERYRLRGHLRGTLKRWPEATGKYAGAGFVVALDDETEVAVFVEAANIKAAGKLTGAGDSSPVSCLVRPLDDGGSKISAHYAKYYPWNESDLLPFPENSQTVRLLARYVDP